MVVSERAVLGGQPNRFMNTDQIAKTTWACVLETLVSPEGGDAFILGSLNGLKRVSLGLEKPIHTRDIHLDISPSPSDAQRA
jgi:hypothetical protein